MPSAPQTKLCTRCGKEKLLTEFFKVSARPDRLASHCRACEKARKAIAYKTAKVIPCEKRCSRCGETKPSQQFWRDGGRKDGLRGYCKLCEKAGVDRDTLSFRHWRKRLRRLGLSAETYERKLQEQNHACSRCGAAQPGGNARHFCVVQDTDGRLVEVVCLPCNNSARERRDSPYRVIDGVREKRCSICGEWKPASGYYPLTSTARRGKVKWTSACIACDIARGHTAEAKSRTRRSSRKSLLKQYGLTPDAYDFMLAAKGGCCAICGGSVAQPHVDHDHRTGRVRGLLCNLCNVMLGSARDSPAILESAKAYLQTTLQQTRKP